MLNLENFLETRIVYLKNDFLSTQSRPKTANFLISNFSTFAFNVSFLANIAK